MNRAVADALILVNWKGVFYERYRLDRHVTALEGANGAGKTTVMIAAFVVLLPDLSRLRFVNLGETGATGGDRGIWGRLGQPGPAYCALELSLSDGSRALAGVFLDRKAAPSLTLTPFIVTDLSADLAEPLLVERSQEQEQVLLFNELAPRFQRLGASFRTFSSAKDYFSALFDMGVGALRLSADEERNKFSEMLRTSMTGGISRVLTSELRSFLFKEQSGLFDTLSRVRQNLDACRRTRLEVAESRVLEGEISGIFEAGQTMFDSACRSARARVDREEIELRKAGQRVEALASEVAECQVRVEETLARRETIERRCQNARARAADAAERSMLAQRAQAVRTRLHALSVTLHEIEPQASDAEAVRTAAADARDQARSQRQTVQVALRKAAEGLANLEAGLDELHRRSHAHHRAREAQERVEALLGSGAAAVDRIDDSLAQVKAERERTDQRRAELDRQQQTLAQRRRDYDTAIVALTEIAGPLEDGANLADRARQELARLNALELSVRDTSELTQRLRSVERQAERREALLEQVEALGIDGSLSAQTYLGQLSAFERELAEQQDKHRQCAAASEAARMLAAQQTSLLEELGVRATLFVEADAAAARLRACQVAVPETSAELALALDASYEARQRKRQWLSDQKLRADGLEVEVATLEAATTAPSEELVGFADEVDGQLLADRYEALEPEAARRVEAELGPLLDAIVVEDPRAAAQRLKERPRSCSTLHFVAAASQVPLHHADRSAVVGGAEQQGQDVIVDTALGVRLTRLPATATLGRQARHQRIERLRRRISAEQTERQVVQSELAALDESHAALQALASKLDVLLAGDPAPARRDCEQEIERQKLVAQRSQEEGGKARVRCARLEVLVTGLKGGVVDAHLLDDAELFAQVEAARSQLAVSSKNRLDLSRLAASRQALAATVHVLALGKPGPELESAWAREQEELLAARDRCFELVEALRGLQQEAEALRWSDAETALAERQRLVPELVEQHEQAQHALERAEQAVEAAEARWEKATSDFQEAQAQLASVRAHRARVTEELEEIGVDDSWEASPSSAAARAADLATSAQALEAEERGLDTELALSRERLIEKQKQAQQAVDDLSAARSRLKPVQQDWSDLQAAAVAAGLRLPEWAGALDLEGAETASAFSQRQLLLERLRGARGGQALAESLLEVDATHAGVVRIWAGVRDWLMRRLPAPVAQLGDPLGGLARLRDDLNTLERRLGHQEGGLKGTSADIARSIEVQVRRAGAQVRRLNQHLVGASFGSVAAIRVHLSRVERMQQVLAALRDGETQSLLFQSDLAIEEAFDQIFKRYGGGRGGGQRLVDFREYLDLSVEIQRRGSEDFQRVNPSQVSTGEAIGIGAALMMVILAEWEREGNLLRQKRAAASLRFLFLDEANRLSQDNLAVLFELCKTLDLQLLIAAPEVARSEGNTTYRLVRRLNDDGQEEVVVSGRRAQVPDPIVAKLRGVDAEAVVTPTQSEMFS